MPHDNLKFVISSHPCRLRVVSNFGDGDCLAMAIVGRAKYTRARAKFRGDATRRERRKLETTDKAREFVPWVPEVFFSLTLEHKLQPETAQQKPLAPRVGSLN